MDRLNQLKNETGGSRDLTLDTSSPPSEAFMTANESSTKFFSLSEVDSTFDVSPSKDSAITTTTESEQTLTDSEIISNLSPIPKKVDNFQIGKQIEAANILSGGVNIFDDNDNSYDGDELVIDDNSPIDDSGKNEEAVQFEKSIESEANSVNVAEAIPSKDTEVVLQIDGKNVDAIAIGNGLYLYRKGVEELAAVQMIDDNQQLPSFKFLKVRENTEGNLEVYEEIEVEVPKKVPTREGKTVEKKANVPIKKISSVTNTVENDTSVDNITEKIDNTDHIVSNLNIDTQPEIKTEVNLNGKKVKLSESRKSPLISTFTPMTYHSTPNKEGIPLTKTMVDQQLHPNRHSDNIKKTIEVHTDGSKKESLNIDKDIEDGKKREEFHVTDIEKIEVQSICAKSLDSLLQKDEANEIKRTDNCDKKENEDINTNKECELKTNNSKENSKQGVDNKVVEAASDNKDYTNNKSVDTNSILEPKVVSSESTICINELDSQIENCDSDSNPKEKEKRNELTNEPIQPVQEKKMLPEIKTKLFKTDNSLNNDDKNIKLQTDGCKTTDLTTINANELKEKIKNKDMSENNVLSTGSDVEKSNKFPNKDDNILNINNVSKAEAVSQKSEKNNEDLNDYPTSLEKVHSIGTPYTNVSPKTEQNDYILQGEKIDCNKKEDTDYIKNSKENDVMASNEIKDVTINSKVDSENTNEMSKKISTIISNNKSKEKDVIEASEKGMKSCKIEMNKANEQKPIPDDVLHILCDKEVEKATTPCNKEVVDSQSKLEHPTTVAKTEITKVKIAEIKSSNTSAVPFGKWTEANRQEFLNKIKVPKVPCSNSNTKQLKQPNDLNRRDILKKIDTQRQVQQTSAKNHDLSAANKANVKTETAKVFVNKPIPSQKPTQEVSKFVASLPETAICKSKQVINKKTSEEQNVNKDKNESLNVLNKQKILVQRKEINNQDLIDKTVEGIINRAVSTKAHEEWKQTIKMDAAETLKSHNSIVSLDDIERKMNELHGIPFVERPAHELPKVRSDINIVKPNSVKSSNIPHHVFKNKLQKVDVKDGITENISDEEIIEHEPITGDMTITESKICAQSSREKNPVEKSRIIDDESKKETIITEKDFDRFVRRNSITYENCLTVNFDGKESHNVIQTLVEKEVPCKKLTRNEMMLAESKAKSTNKHLLMRHNTNHNKISLSVKSASEEDSFNKNYQSQSKVQLAYQSALTAKRQLECPVTIIEDKPVKVVFLDSGSDFTSSNLNVQGQELSPPKNTVLDSDSQSASESLDSDVLDTPYELKLQEETKSKSKHQRKQVLTPVDIPDLELIEPSDLGITESPKKKRKFEDSKERQAKIIAPKKSYLLNRAISDEKTITEDTAEIKLKASGTETKSYVPHSDTISAIDNLVKAAELIETQSENKGNVINLQISESEPNTPPKRGRGRPRKYPLSETSSHDSKTPTIQKKPRLIESNISKKIVETDDSDSNDEFIKENWTMGKINENIVCPICNKLFRSENVVFKHVKHCTGPSPNRSDSDRRSLRQFSQSSSDSDSSEDSEDDKDDETKLRVKPVLPKKDEIIVIEDTPLKDRTDETKLREFNRTTTKNKLFLETDKLVCEFCGKTFRQLSYLVNHKQQHKKEDEKKIEKSEISLSKSIFSCEVCKKQFRKLHHLVQHRIIHNQNSMPSRLLRKNSNDKNDEKRKDDSDNKRTIRNEDQSAGFRCEPCDKSFRKLHHLVEHRETHDGINKKGTTINNAQLSGEVAKSSAQHICRFCKKSFKKLQHLMEHKEQHLDSCSDKSDDKSVKSSLSTKDIIHECSLCYMVFPNEHSLNKHTVICLRKKKQSAAKQAKLRELKEKGGEEILEDDDKLSEDDNQNQSDKECENEPINEDNHPNKSPIIEGVVETLIEKIEISDDNICENEIKSIVAKDESIHINCENNEILNLKRNIKEEKFEKLDDNTGKRQGKTRKIEVITILDTPTPKKKSKENCVSGPKRLKTNSVTQLVLKKEKASADTSDEDEIRYMLNPNFKEEVTAAGKVFMKVRANKRSSLQFERPNSKDLIKRRISLQNPPKVQRNKIKPTESKSVKITPDKRLNVPVINEHTDSDDSDVKYSFPETDTQNNKKDKGKTVKRQSIVAKRKSVTGIAKRKSLAKHKIPIPTQKAKRRTTEVEHRCDCGQLFSSAALLSRHTTLSHTPPRVRRPRDPPPDNPPQTSGSSLATTFEKRKTADQPKLNAPQQQRNKSVAPSNKPTVKVSRKSSAGSSASKSPSSKVVKSETNVKTLRSSAHRGVPVPDKMRKFMERAK